MLHYWRYVGYLSRRLASLRQLRNMARIVSKVVYRQVYGYDLASLGYGLVHDPGMKVASRG